MKFIHPQFDNPLGFQAGRMTEKRDIHESKRNSNNKKTVKNWKDTKAHDYGAQSYYGYLHAHFKKIDTQCAQQQQSRKNKKNKQDLCCSCDGRCGLVCFGS